MKNIIAGVESRGLTCQIVKVYSTADLAEIAKMTAEFSRYKISVALQINGRVYIHDGRKEQDEAVRGYYNMVMSSPEIYQQLGEVAAEIAQDKTSESIEIPRRGAITEYQLKMVKVSTDESQFVKKYKNMENLQID